MSFAYPWVLLVFPLAVWLALRKPSSIGLTVASLGQWANLNKGRARFLWLLTGLELLFYGGLLIALARPQAGSSESNEEAEGIAIELLVDVSSSMDRAIDLPGGGSKTRMEIAKELMEQFILGDGERLTGRSSDLVGLISFARYADTRSPLTFGHKALTQIVGNLEIQDRPNEDGTAYGDALTLACARLKNLDEQKSLNASRKLAKIESRIVVLLTDGENNSGNHLPVEAAGLAKHWGIRVYTISLGEEGGAQGIDIVFDESEFSTAELVLKRISDETGGVFRRATSYESLKSIYEEIDTLERSSIETRSFKIVSEWYWLPLTVALLVLIGWMILQTTWLRVAS